MQEEQKAADVAINLEDPAIKKIIEQRVTERVEEQKELIRVAALETKAKEWQKSLGINAGKDLDKIAAELILKGKKEAESELSKKEKTLEETVISLQSKIEDIEKQKQNEILNAKKLRHEAEKEKIILKNKPAQSKIDDEDFLALSKMITTTEGEDGVIYAADSEGSPLKDSLFRPVKYSDAILGLAKKYEVVAQPKGVGGSDSLQSNSPTSREAFESNYVKDGGNIGSEDYWFKLKEARAKGLIK